MYKTKTWTGGHCSVSSSRVQLAEGPKPSTDPDLRPKVEKGGLDSEKRGTLNGGVERRETGKGLVKSPLFSHFKKKIISSSYTF